MKESLRDLTEKKSGIQRETMAIINYINLLWIVLVSLPYGQGKMSPEHLIIWLPNCGKWFKIDTYFSRREIY
jgi:hypothetical protein